MALRSKVVLASVVVALGVTACGLPRSGPTKSELKSGSIERRGDAVIVPVTAQVVRLTDVKVAYGFPRSLLNAPATNTDVIRKGDILNLTVYENIETGVLGTAGAASNVGALVVDGDGKIFVPYVGRVTASGKTIEQLRQELTEKLATQTPDPQVQLTRASGNGSSVTVIGDAAQGVVPLDSTNKSLSGLLASVGSASLADAAATVVTVERGRESGKIWLDDLLTDRSNDVNLRPGDRIIIQKDSRQYITIGEAGQGIGTFTKPSMSALDVLSASGGISSASGDPKGVFILRTERSEIASSFYDDPAQKQSDRVIYLLDMAQPNGLFLARDFQIQPDDIVYVSEAPYSSFTKIVSTLLGTVTQANQVSDAVSGQ